MRRSLRSVLGVTLLEIMLVLAIASLIILMSVRYYQSTTTASQTQQVIGMISAITATADNLALGSTDGYVNVTDANIQASAGSAALVTPWGGTATITSSNATSYIVTIPTVPAAVCTTVKLKIVGNPKYKLPDTCDGGSFVYTYNSSAS